MRKFECRDAAYRFITAYSWLDHTKDRMMGAGVRISELKETLDVVSEQFENLSRAGHLTDSQLTDLRVNLQDIKDHLPAVEKLPPEEYEQVKQPIRDSERLMNKLTEVMFESVADCECLAVPSQRLARR